MAKTIKNKKVSKDLVLSLALFAFLLITIITVVKTTVSSQLNSYASSRNTAFTTDQWSSALSKAIHADVDQSVMLPNGSILWIFGDTTQVNGVSTVGGYGYPHDAFVLQSPNTLTFTPVPGKYGYGWAQVPNWSDGTFFWMATPIVDGNTLYILGSRIQATSTSFSGVGQYVAIFDAKTLTYQKIVQVPAGSTNTTAWGGVARVSNGWWIPGTHAVSCTYATDCKAGDMAFVPTGKLATPSSWKVYNDVIPATTNVGTTLGLLHNGNSWDIFTKLGDAYGGTQIEKLTASSPTGTWTVNGTWATPSPSGTVTYAVAVHPEQTSPLGQVLVSYAVNGVDADYFPLFEYLPK